VACEAIELDVYLLIPQTSDHLFNLEHDSSVTLMTAGWELRGRAQITCQHAPGLELGILSKPEAEWCVLVRIDPHQVHIRRDGGWGLLETFDLKTP